MKATKTQKFMLFSLGAWFEEANERIKDKPLKVSISKALFIDLVQNAGIAEKQERALYKNLETLEKKKLVSYKHRELELTAKGNRLYQEIKKELSPYFNVRKKLTEKSPTSYTKKVQTVFSEF
jgi:DNA-binding PadR family transcriptional regulator